jgi:hypothetical protein
MERRSAALCLATAWEQGYVADAFNLHKPRRITKREISLSEVKPRTGAPLPAVGYTEFERGQQGCPPGRSLSKLLSREEQSKNLS